MIHTVNVRAGDLSNTTRTLRAVGARVLSSAPCTVTVDDKRVPGYSITYTLTLSF
jgi:hypothetical protein